MKKPARKKTAQAAKNRPYVDRIRISAADRRILEIEGLDRRRPGDEEKLRHAFRVCQAFMRYCEKQLQTTPQEDDCSFMILELMNQITGTYCHLVCDADNLALAARLPIFADMLHDARSKYGDSMTPRSHAGQFEQQGIRLVRKAGKRGKKYGHSSNINRFVRHALKGEWWNCSMNVVRFRKPRKGHELDDIMRECKKRCGGSPRNLSPFRPMLETRTVPKGTDGKIGKRTRKDEDLNRLIDSTPGVQWAEIRKCIAGAIARQLGEHFRA